MTAAGESVPDGELLARYITSRGAIRTDGTIKPDAWMPPRDLRLSVTRHSSLGEAGIWGRAVALEATTGRRVGARADLLAADVRRAEFPGMDVVECPEPGNPEHAHVMGWPPLAEKARHKIIAMKFAESSKLVMRPDAPE